MALSGILSFFNLKNIQIFLLSHNDIFAQTPGYIKIELKNKYFLPCFLIRIRLEKNEIILPFVKDKILVNLPVIFQKRGKIKISEIFVSSYFPFYFFKRILRLPIDYEIIVFPKPIKCEFSNLLHEGKTKLETTLTRGSSFEGEITGVKEYSIQDPLKYIHWKTTAKTSELMTKEFSPYKGNPVILKLADFQGDIEQKIGKITYAILSFSEQGIPVGLKIDNTVYKPDLRPSHIRRLLYALSVY
jgi:uncharacterized protein (DUF58 family)